MRLHRRPSPRSTENVNVLNRRVKPWVDFSSQRPPARSNSPPAGGERTPFIRQVRKNSHISPTHPQRRQSVSTARATQAPKAAIQMRNELAEQVPPAAPRIGDLERRHRQARRHHRGHQPEHPTAGGPTPLGATHQGRPFPIPVTMPERLPRPWRDRSGCRGHGETGPAAEAMATPARPAAIQMRNELAEPVPGQPRRGSVTLRAVIDKLGDTITATSQRTHRRLPPPPLGATHQGPPLPNQGHDAGAAAEATARPARLDLAGRATGRWPHVPRRVPPLHLSHGPSGRPPSPTRGLRPLPLAAQQQATCRTCPAGPCRIALGFAAMHRPAALRIPGRPRTPDHPPRACWHMNPNLRAPTLGEHDPATLQTAHNNPRSSRRATAQLVARWMRRFRRVGSATTPDPACRRRVVGFSEG